MVSTLDWSASPLVLRPTGLVPGRRVDQSADAADVIYAVSLRKKSFLQLAGSEGSSAVKAVVARGTTKPAKELNPLQRPMRVPQCEGAMSTRFIMAGTLHPLRE